MKNETIFKADCDRGYCNRQTMYTDNCLKDHKQTKCYVKYIKKEQKDLSKQDVKTDSGYILTSKKDILWQEVCREVDYRDKVCIIWNKVLIDTEKSIIESQFSYELEMLKILDHCHIISKGRNKTLIYDMNNIFLAKRFFHQRFDQYRDLVSGEKMNKEEHELWVGRIKKYMII